MTILRTRHIRPLLVLLAVLLVAGLAVVPAWTKKKKKKEPRLMTTIQLQRAVAGLKDIEWWRLYGGLQCAKSDTMTSGYIQQLPDFGADAMAATRRLLDRQHERCAELLAVRHDLLLDADAAKRPLTDEQQQDFLTRRLGEQADHALKCFAAAADFERRYARLTAAMDAELAARQPRVAPAGHLRHLTYHSSNGLSGYEARLELTRQPDGTGWLTERASRFGREESDRSAVVPDSVMTQLAQTIVDRRLYEIGRRYQPDYDVTDATSWELTVLFASGSIQSQGYASYPAKDYGLDALLDTLSALLQE